MRVLMSADAVGGVWTYALDLAHELAVLGIGVDLAVLGPSPSPAQVAEAAAVPGLALHDSGGARLEWMDEPWDDVERSGQWLLALAETLRPDLVHLAGYAHGALPFPAPVVVVAHSCVVSWWRAVHGGPPPPRYDEYRRRVTAGLRAADLVVAPTPGMLDELVRCYGPVGRSLVIANGRRGDLFRADPLAPRDEVVLAAGRLWDPAKGLEALDRAARGLPWPVEVAGERRRPAATGAGTVVAGAARLLGRLAPEALAARMRRAAIFAAPARYEPFGLGILEAGLAGCALVLGDIPTLRQTWQDAARFVPPGDARRLRGALGELVAAPDERQRLAVAAERRARSLDAATMAARYVQTYRGLGAPPPATAMARPTAPPAAPGRLAAAH